MDSALLQDGVSCNVFAVVVTYHPADDVLENLSTLRQQVAAIVVVDNGSAELERTLLRETCARLDATLIENDANLGISAALNQGIRLARERGCEWILLFDQDSRVTDGFLDAMLRFFASNPWGERLAIVNPRYVDLRFGTDLPQHRQINGKLEAATTSGSLSPMRIFNEVGLFAEELFIDGVDYEYSLRLREKGFVIASCPEAVLLHSPGEPTHHKFFRKKAFHASNYAPVRRYYQERNKIWNARRYGRRFPGFFVNQFTISLKDLVKIMLVEKNSWPKFRFFMRGIADGLRGRTGKLKESNSAR